MKLKVFIKGLLAGFAISFGGWLALRTNSVLGNNILGSFIFSLGLILICNFDYYLFTGKVCYLVVDETDTFKNKFLNLLIGLAGNFIGCIIVGLIIRSVFYDPDALFGLFPSLNGTVKTKLNYPWYVMIILGAFCGFFIFFAVEGFKKIENLFGKYVVLILSIGAFIICGFEHCVANMFYFALNGTFTLDMVLATVYCVIGNSIGGLFFPFMHSILKK